MSSVSREMRCCFGGLEKFQRAHVVQAVGEFDQHDAHVVHHGQNHLADVFGLARFGRHHVQAADFGDAFDEMRDFGAEALVDARDGKLGVFDDVVQQRGGKRRGVEPHVREDVRNFQQMREVRLAGTAELLAMALGGDFIGAADQPGVFRWAIFAELVEEFLEAGVELALGAVAVEI